MAMEDNIRLIVEQVLTELSKNPQKMAGAACATSPTDSAGSDVENITDLAKVDLQRYLQVPEPLNRALYEEMKLSTPARIGVWRSGTRPLTDTLLRFRADHAVAQDSVLGEVPVEFPEKYNMVCVKTMCESKDEYLTRPDLGRKLDEASLNLIRSKCRKGAKLQIIVADGLSSKAVEANIPNLLPAMLQGLEGMGIEVGTPIFVQYSRVGIMDSIGEELKPEAAIVLLGERPGLGTAESMSAYIGYHPRAGMLESERTVVSNIHKGGTPAAEAGAHLATLLKKILDAKASGVNLH
ncbi:MAG TPA: ethanolamine ammonia-lyase subunit EutC [Negativicutes bacterium]|nr:ethanolamine ammonia-lyase subunit EutC [Negativicutes bacterium]